ncbi:lipid A biosynthesis lauroyl acyltransferase [Aquamicrobium zhengzhouense]|uniref:Lipid A biosynthesis lauroyl acyltransferase n=1 Tax=Aquamicrobium zhengzhouense TaxID=2781738 RepID=A0ABS0S7S3_9HYPH|nr:lipid A biosynthesis lauroyl acyltransferase [Aquamicrobium zhengzhouense]MBI1619348.1 lipid A biosynthesis lauroyl acyltransferase [Aquamicrobium zhengzhouense]
MSGGLAPLLRPTIARTLRAVKTTKYWLVAQLARGVLYTLRLLPAEKALSFAERAARWIGPKTKRHQITLDNIRQAYPEKTEAEVEELALDMWGHMARLFGEYIFIDQLFDYVPGSDKPGRVEVIGDEIFLRIREQSDRPHIVFTAHMGNFELLPIAAAAYDLPISVLFRAPNNPFIAKYLFATRATHMGDMVASRAGAAFTLARVLERDGNIGALVDQKFSRGVPTTFFGRKCLTSPLIGKLARQYDCDVYPARSVRLPGNRYRLEVQEKLVLPRNEKGVVDVPATTQLLNDIVEGWVREDPGQWMWFHKRWEIK